MRKEKKNALALVLVFTAQIIAIKAHPCIIHAERGREREMRCVSRYI